MELFAFTKTATSKDSYSDTLPFVPSPLKGGEILGVPVEGGEVERCSRQGRGSREVLPSGEDTYIGRLL